MYKSFKIEKSHSFKLYYFNIRGRGETIRLIFAAAGVAFEDERIKTEDWPTLKKEMPWGALPVLEVDGQRRIGQSNAICRFLAGEFGLAGDDTLQATEIDSIAETITDIREKFAAAYHEKDPDKKEQQTKLYKEDVLPPILDKLESLITDTNGFLYENKLTWADLHLFACGELLDVTFPSVSEALSNHPKLLKHHKMVSQLDLIREWLEKRPKTDF